MSELGLVSRVSPVHTAVRNCTRDEGRSFEVGNQVLISSHRKLLSSVRWLIACAMRTVLATAATAIQGDATLHNAGLWPFDIAVAAVAAGPRGRNTDDDGEGRR